MPTAASLVADYLAREKARRKYARRRARDPEGMRAKERRKYARRKARDPEGTRAKERRAYARRRAQQERRATPLPAFVGLWEPTKCANCDSRCGPTLYCSAPCKQAASTIRYARRVIRDGRIRDDPSVAEAIQVRVAFVLAGGYPERERRLSPDTRRAVVERDGGLCRTCGKPGTEVDHIAGNSSSLDNLQLLCNRCHMAKTQANLKPVDPEDTKTMNRLNEVRRRIAAAPPERACDDDRKWPHIWRDLLRHARESANRDD